MANIVNNRLFDRFTIKLRSEIGLYAGYPSLRKTTPTGSNGLHISGAEHHPYADFNPKFLYKPEET